MLNNGNEKLTKLNFLTLFFSAKIRLKLKVTAQILTKLKAISRRKPQKSKHIRILWQRKDYMSCTLILIGFWICNLFKNVNIVIFLCTILFIILKNEQNTSKYNTN